jgi:dephospho-CoA kinase
MLTIAVTGGIACGKSAFTGRFRERVPEGGVSVFSCDEAVRELNELPEVRECIAGFGRGHGRSLGGSGGLDRTGFRELLFENSEFRGKVEGLLHPLVLQRAVDHIRSLPPGVKILLVEVPLLYEADFPLSRDLDLAVAASERVQTLRLRERRGFSGDLIRRMLRSQMPIEEKIKRADVVVWNDGSLDALNSQTDHLLSRCQTLFDS